MSDPRSGITFSSTNRSIWTSSDYAVETSLLIDTSSVAYLQQQVSTHYHGSWEQGLLLEDMFPLAHHRLETLGRRRSGWLTSGG